METALPPMAVRSAPDDISPLLGSVVVLGARIACLEKGEGRREKGEGRREKGEGRRAHDSRDWAAPCPELKHRAHRRKYPAGTDLGGKIFDISDRRLIMHFPGLKRRKMTHGNPISCHREFTLRSG